MFVLPKQRVLIVLCGPPAVGKLAIGKELASLLQFRLFHNRLTLAPVAALFPGKEYAVGLDALRSIRTTLLSTAMESTDATGIIFTYAYNVEDGRAFLDDIRHLAIQMGWVPKVVSLCASSEVLSKRVVSEDRATLGKTTDVGVIERLFSDGTTLHPPKTDLQVCTEAQPPDVTARQIASELGL